MESEIQMIRSQVERWDARKKADGTSNPVPDDYVAPGVMAHAAEYRAAVKFEDRIREQHSRLACALSEISYVRGYCEALPALAEDAERRLTIASEIIFAVMFPGESLKIEKGAKP